MYLPKIILKSWLNIKAKGRKSFEAKAHIGLYSIYSFNSLRMDEQGGGRARRCPWR